MTAANTSGFPRPKVVLVGPPGAGKSTVGRRLAKALNVGLVDSDDLLSAAYGKPCGEVFSELGEDGFRDVEPRYVREALRSDGVVSLGGGAVLSAANRAMLAGYTVVHIDVSAEEGVRRTAGDTNRPVLAADDRLAHYRGLLDEREQYYREVAGFRARTDGRGPQQVVGDILGYLDTRQP